MIKKIVVILIICLTVITASWVFAQNCPDISGDWDFSFEGVFYTPASGHSFEQIRGTLHISEQQGCLFFGSIKVNEMSEVDCVVTGSIRGRNIAMTMCGAIMRGTLWGNNRMKLTVEDIELFYGDMQSAALGTATRR